jgi:hypothetical protein
MQLLLKVATMRADLATGMALQWSARKGPEHKSKTIQIVKYPPCRGSSPLLGTISKDPVRPYKTISNPHISGILSGFAFRFDRFQGLEMVPRVEREWSVGGARMPGRFPGGRL